MKLILIEDIQSGCFTGFLDEIPSIVIQCETENESHKQIQLATLAFSNFALEEGDKVISDKMLEISKIEKFELTVYKKEHQLQILKQDKLLK